MILKIKMNSTEKTCFIFLILLILFYTHASPLIRIKSKLPLPTEWVPSMILNSTNYWNGLIDPNDYIGNTDDKNKIIQLIDKLKLEKNIDVTLIFIPAISKNYTRSNRTEEKDIFQFVDDLSALLVSKNKIADSSSLIILFSINDRQMRIRTGEEVRKKITDSSALEILDSVKSRLRNSLYGVAGLEVLQSCSDSIYQEPPPLWAIILFSLFLFYCCCIPRRKQNYQDAQSDPEIEQKLVRIKEIKISNVSKNKFIQESCIICLETFKSSNKVIDKTNKFDNHQNEETTNLLQKDLSAVEVDCNKNQTVLEVKEIPKETQNLIHHPEEKEISHLESNLTSLECGHCFHTYCIEQWNKRQNNCPICRKSMNSNKENSTDANELQRDIIDIQTELNPNMSNYNIIFDIGMEVLRWETRRTVYYTYDAPLFFQPRTMEIVSDIGRIGWNTNSGGASSRW